MKHILRKTFLLVCFLCSCFAVSAIALEIPDNIPHWKDIEPETLAGMLEYGELIAVDNVGGGKIEMVSIGMLADAPPERVWDIITDFEGYSELLPDQLTTTSLEKKGNIEVVRYVVIVLKVPLISITAKYTLKYHLDKPRRADIGWVEGDVKNVAGYWELFPVDEGRRTVVIYSITSDLGSVNPIVGPMLARQPATVMAINLSSAIIFTKRLMEKVTGKKRPRAPAGSKPVWKTLDEKTLYKLLSGGRVGFISRIGDQEIASSGVVVRKNREHVWNVLTDFEKYPEKIKQITRSKILDSNEKMARVKVKTDILRLGPINIASEGVTKYFFDKPSKMWSEDEKRKKKRADLFNRWELVSLADGTETGLFNEAVSDLSTMGWMAKTMLSRLPALQISVDLSQGMIMVNEIGKWAEGK